MPGEFTELIARVRAGDARAAEELVQEYGPLIRLEVRRRMRDPRLRRVFDSLDVCQSVLASFFVRAALGQYDLDDPAEVVKLLVGMARNKVACEARKQTRECRDLRRVEAFGDRHLDAVAPGPSPSQAVAGEELLLAVRQELSDEERQIADRRAQGQSWDEIAVELGGTGQGRRKQLERAIERVVQRFELDEAERG
jgi:RNA polymerase sigma-70 factor (ECF subfamily)